MEKSSINQVFAWGLGAEGQLGAEDFERSAIPIKSKIFFDIIEISCGGQFSGCITSENILFMWGTNKKNQLGLIDSELKYPIPVMIKLKKPIILLSCGDWHTVILDNEGFVYGTGYNKSGCLGLGDFQNRTGFEIVEDKEVGKIKGISAGRNISLYLTIENQIKSAGRSILNGNSLENQNKILCITELKSFQIKNFSAGFSACACTDDSGSLYTWGEGTDFQLGHGNITNISTPQKVEHLKDKTIVKVSCSRAEKHTHMACIDSEGKAYTWGAGYKGKLGHGNFEDYKFPKKIEFFERNNIRIKEIIVGGIHSAAISEDGKLFTFGCGSDGRLGHPELGSHKYLYKETEPKIVERFQEYFVQKCKSSYYHMIALVKI